MLGVGRGATFVFPKFGRKNPKTRRVVLEYVDSIIIAGVAALFIIHFLFRTFYIPSGSMIPTLKVKDYILVNEFIYKLKEPTYGDVVVFKPPPEANAEGKDFIKRVMALEGDTISVRGGKVFINGEAKDEPYVEFEPDYYYPPMKVPSGNLFVMGDNRPSSADSHVWGFLPVKNVVGKAVLIILPISRIRILK
ncbi:MAG: signal peptidase I [Candidatus Eremiobacteraeota bacterium]|nr:signal peptidase I [Candidatus Eremiobacteraeota bacterium]